MALNTKAQPAYLTGVYNEVCPIWSYERNTFEFFPNNTFTYYKTSDFGEFYGTGKYTLSEDSILFEFSPIAEANNTFEMLTGPVDTTLQREKMSTIRVYHSLYHNTALNFSYRHFRNDTLVANGGMSPYGLSKVQLIQGDSIFLYATNWENYAIGIPFKVKEPEPRSYVFIAYQKNIGLVHQGHNEKLAFKLNKNKEKLTLKRAQSPNFLHPDLDGKIEYQLRH